MSVTSNYNEHDKELVITVSGSFDYRQHRDFRDAYQEVPNYVKYIIDLSKTEHLDSSALGMLLLLRDHAGSDNSTIILRGCRPNIRRVLEIAHFDRLFILN